MSQKNQTFAFIVGEVSPAFYGRLDLQKYPFGLAEAENFFVDYHGGLLNRSGSVFIAMLPEQEHRFARFRTKESDIVLFFTAGKMRVLKNKSFLLTEAAVSAACLGGVITSPNTLTVDSLVYVDTGTLQGYFNVTARTAGTLTIDSPIGQVVPDGPVSWAPVYELLTPFSGPELEDLKFTQDLNRVVCTRDTRLPVFIERAADTSWAVSTFANNLPTAPTGLTGVASDTGAASVGFAVTAVVDGVESQASVELVTNGIVNYSAVSGFFTFSWAAVPGASRYNVYRSVVYPSTYPVGAQLGYLGYTSGLTFQDKNITPDYTKTIPVAADYFADDNYPALYATFQQRGVYAGLAKEPLTVVGSVSGGKGTFSVSFPPIASDSYSYTIDAESERPIKHMLALRYGLMLFTDDGTVQLRGGDSTSLNAVSALAEVQGYMSVSDLAPVAINMDVLFMPSLYSELNQMVYTEYTNSFKMQDILVLSTHLFGPNNKAVDISWAPEPYKVLYFIREDGQKVALTYERNLEVYGWTRNRTKGDYLRLQVIKEDEYNLAYQTVRRRIAGESVMFIEREMPRGDECYTEMWFVDAGKDRPLIKPPHLAQLSWAEDGSADEPQWEFRSSDLSWASADQIIYVQKGMFRVDEVNAGYLKLALMRTPHVSTFYDKKVIRVAAGKWGYNETTGSLKGLWWLEGETVSVLNDGDASAEVVVVNGEVAVVNDAAFIVAGIGYSARARTLPLSLPNYALGGFPLTLRGVTLRPLKTRGLAVGASYEDAEELPARGNESWDNPLEPSSEFTTIELWGSGGWALDAQICFEQKYPLPAGVIGFSFDLDLGE